MCPPLTVNVPWLFAITAEYLFHPLSTVASNVIVPLPVIVKLPLFTSITEKFLFVLSVPSLL